MKPREKKAAEKNIPGAQWLEKLINEKVILAAIFVFAFALRLIYVIQYSKAPDFIDPIGDSKIYME